MGTKYILTVLTENGFEDTAYRIASQTTYPSWGYWIELGATSLYEKWEEDSRSFNHHMYGTIEDWYYKNLAGIKPLEPGFKSIIIKPYLPSSLDQVNARIKTSRGEVGSSWKRKENSLKFDIEIPLSSRGEVLLPAKENSKEIEVEAKRSGINFTGKKKDRYKFMVDSGKYLFEYNIEENKIEVK